VPGDQLQKQTRYNAPLHQFVFSRNVDEQLTDVHVGQLSADAAGVFIPYLQRNEVSLVTAFDLRSFNPYNNMRAVMDIYGPVELNLELNSQTPYEANTPVLNFVYLVRKFVS
jgi:hypothetical protein